MNATNSRVSGKGFAHPRTAPAQASAPAQGTHYRLTNEEWLTLWDNLRPAEIKVLLHLRTLAPFGDRNLDIKVRELGRRLGMAHSTVSKALKVLDAKGYIETDLIDVSVRVRSGMVPEDTNGSSRNHRGSSGTTEDRQEPPHLEPSEPETPDATEPEPFSTEPPFVPEQTLKNSVKNRSGLATGESLNNERIGTSLKSLIESSGIPLNAALLSVLNRLEERHPECAYERVRNAVSAYEERKESILNPQGFVSAALRRGFTSNQAKRQKRARQTVKQERTHFPPAPAMPQILDLSGLIAEIQIACQTLGITVKQALERFGRAGRSLADLPDVDLATLRRELAGWT